MRDNVIVGGESTPTGATVEDEPDITLNLRNTYHQRIRIITCATTINVQILSGKLGKVTQTEVIRK